MKFLSAVGCLLLACLVGYIFLDWGIDHRGAAIPISPLVLYLGVVVCVWPFWLFTFVPLYLLVNSDSFLWRWYIAPLSGILIGFIGTMMMGGQAVDFPRFQEAPMIIGFSLFFLGALSKKCSSPLASLGRVD